MFSVLIPSYNAEKTILRTINSVLNQTYSDYEILIMDDGSKDNTVELINSIKDLRIKLFQQENSGPGTARNNLIEKATADYIVFLDADDYLDVNFFEYLHDEIIRKKPDVVFINVKRVNNQGDLIETQNISKYIHESKDEIINRQLTGQIPWGACRKVYKTRLIKSNNIKFLEVKVGEESLFSFMALKQAQSFSILNEALYYYVDTPNSLSKYIVKDQYISIYEAIYTNLSEKNLLSEHETALNTLLFIGTILNIRYFLYKQENFDIKFELNQILIKKPSVKYMTIKYKFIYLMSKFKLYFLIKIGLKWHLKHINK